MPSKIHKRDGRIVKFRQSNISQAMLRAFQDVGVDINPPALTALTKKVIAECNRRYRRSSPTAEDVQDIVKFILLKAGYERTVRAYMNYRQEHKLIRGKKSTGKEDSLGLSINAVNVLKRRYLLKDDQGRVIETPAQMFRRVAKAVASVESRYGDDPKVAEQHFYNTMSKLDFLPNSPTLMNAGTPLGQLSACFVLPIDDSMVSIFDTLKHMAIIHQSGGGTGFSFSRLRPKGDIVLSTKCRSSGPVSFMNIFDKATDVIKQGGRRRGANMGILRIDHPDILAFIRAKADKTAFQNFNLSVAVTDKFMRAVSKNKKFSLRNPRTGKTTARLDAKEVFRMITTMAWNSGDPGLIFIDRINRFNPTPNLGHIESTNPCGEEPLLPYESCNLGSINLSRFTVKKGKVKTKIMIDWPRLKKTVHLAVRFLDDVIDANIFPLEEIEEHSKATRKIGLGVMGFADLLIKLKIPYGSDASVKTARKLMKFIYTEARNASSDLAKERGSFPKFKHSRVKKGYKRMRNATVTTVAPTGSISIIAGCSSGIEPLFGISYVRNVMSGTALLEVNEAFNLAINDAGIPSKTLMRDIAKKGSIKGMKKIPLKLRRLFITAHDIKPEAHVKIQAAFQKFTDSAVSKTVNLSETARIGDVGKIYMLAWKMGCKGVTIYRYGSREDQVLFFDEHLTAHPEYSGGCSMRECSF